MKIRASLLMPLLAFLTIVAILSAGVALGYLRGEAPLVSLLSLRLGAQAAAGAAAAASAKTGAYPGTVWFGSPVALIENDQPTETTEATGGPAVSAHPEEPAIVADGADAGSAAVVVVSARSENDNRQDYAASERPKDDTTGEDHSVLPAAAGRETEAGLETGATLTSYSVEAEALKEITALE
jgi:hypothetical protein